MNIENTPLQNLRNILFEADISANTSVKKIDKTITNRIRNIEEKVVSREDLQEVVFRLKATPRQYVTKVEICQIFLNICKKNEKSGSLDMMETLKEFIKDKVL